MILMPVSAIVSRILGWRTPPRAEMRIADLEWPLLDWVRSVAANHVVRVLAGQLLRGTPPWTAYLRLSGARIGRRVYVNSLSVSDYNLLVPKHVTLEAGGVYVGVPVRRGVRGRSSRMPRTRAA